MNRYRRLITHHARLKFTCIIAGLLIFLLSTAGTSYAQRFVFKGKIKKDALDFIQVKNLIIIPIYINDKGPYNFLLDTGVGQMIITDTSFLSKLDMRQSKVVKVQGYGLGDEIEAILTRNVTVRVGKATINNAPTAIFKEDIFDLSSYLGVKIYGILGYYFFNSFVVKINYETSRLTFYAPNAALKKKGTKIPIQILNGKPYMYAEVNSPTLPETKVRLLVDNGSSHPLMLEALDNSPFPLPPLRIPANLGVGINGEIRGAMGRVANLKIEDFVFENVVAGFPQYDSKRNTIEGNSRNGTLGGDVLKHFLVTFDYENDAMYLKKTRSFNKKFEHDMSGLELYTKQDKFNSFYIGRIEPGSSAEEAGLKTGDEILSINFKDVENYSLNDLTELFREGDGRQLIAQVLRKGERLIVVITLRRRI